MLRITARSHCYIPLLLLGAALLACTSNKTAQEEEPIVLSLRERWTQQFDEPDTAADFDDIFLLGHRVVAVESSTASISAFSLDSGEPLWKKGRRGAGPEEYLEPRQLFGYYPNFVGVVDSKQGRITLLREDGSLERVITGERVVGDLTNVCGAREGVMLAVRLPRFEVIKISEQPEAQVLYELRWPVSTYNEAAALQQGLFARSRDGQCVVFQPRGDFFFAVRGDSLRLDSFHRYAKPFPAQTIDRTQQFPRISPGGIAAAYAVVKSDTLFVLRGHIAPDDVGKVDVYLLGTGKRVAVLALPPQSVVFDVADSHLLVLQNTDNGSLLTLFDR